MWLYEAKWKQNQILNAICQSCCEISIQCIFLSTKLCLVCICPRTCCSEDPNAWLGEAGFYIEAGIVIIVCSRFGLGLYNSEWNIMQRSSLAKIIKEIEIAFALIQYMISWGIEVRIHLFQTRRNSFYAEGRLEWNHSSFE